MTTLDELQGLADRIFMTPGGKLACPPPNFLHCQTAHATWIDPHKLLDTWPSERMTRDFTYLSAQWKADLDKQRCRNAWWLFAVKHENKQKARVV